MTKKDYIKFAAVLKEVRAQINARPSHPAHKAVDFIQSKLIDIFIEDNPQFDPGRFLEAATTHSGERA